MSMGIPQVAISTAFRNGGVRLTGPSADATAGYALVGNGDLTTDWAARREVLTANRTYYIRSDGDDGNTGLVDSSGGAFLTLQKFIDVAGTLDLSIYDVTGQIGVAGTYAGFTVSAPFVGGPGSSVTVLGSTSSPSSYVISSTIKAENYATVNVSGLDITTGTTPGLQADGGVINMTGVSVFGATTSAAVYALNGGTIRLLANYTIDGNLGWQLFAEFAGQIGEGNGSGAGVTVTLTGTPAWSGAYAKVQDGGIIRAVGNTYSGSATGKRYDVLTNGMVRTLGGASYFPGNAAGTTDGFGVYH